GGGRGGVLQHPLVGTGQADITPPLGTRFGGFWIERPSPATAVHDPLLATAVVLANGADAIAIVSCDLQTISPDVVARVRARVEAERGIPPEHVLVAATHDHAAPGGDASERQIPEVDSFYTSPEAEQRIEDGIIAAVTEAFDGRRAAELRGQRGEIAGIGRSRNDPAEPATSPATVLLAYEPGSDAPFAAVVNYGCHPSVLGPDSTALTADYPGVLRRELARRLGVESVTFLNAPAGDISTRHTRCEQTFEELERLGLALSDQIEALASSLVPVASGTVSGLRTLVDLPVDPSLLLRLSAALEHEADRDSQRATRLRMQLERLRAIDGPTIPCEVQVLRCGELAIVGVAGELFSGPGRLIVDASPAGWTLVVAPANGTVGNLPAPEQHGSIRPLVGLEAEALIRQAAGRLLEHLFMDKQKEDLRAG
ncbi:MAG: neutral/alkaline non-lysosomal ceramidase N-terminal domain-containing protein, partial [Chloroflexota bacterium]|nr:neutral/alkaline non-lysosomal ceramidase N-terminal domain-containing protein [Chloroflexota bacterium]